MMLTIKWYRIVLHQPCFRNKCKDESNYVMCCSCRKKHEDGCRKPCKKIEEKSDKTGDEFLHKTRRVQNKTILKESKLKLPSNLLSLVNKKKKDEGNEQNDEFGHSCNLKDSQRSAVTDMGIHRSCSMEFRKASSTASTAECSSMYTQNNLYDNESDELAEYLEHVLFLPKPMSAMAEMMYG